VADDEVGPRVDGGVRERGRVSTGLAEVELGPGADVDAVAALATGVHGDHDEIRLLRGAPDERLRRGDVEEVLRPRVGREAENGDPR
jgi:hypothetical protein